MITTEEIRSLLQAGETEKAYQEAETLLASNPEDAESRKIMAACIKEKSGQAAKAGDINGVTDQINRLAELRLEEIGEAELNNRLAWDIRALVLTLTDQKKFDAGELDSLFDALTGIAFLKPHRYYSILLDSLMRVRDEEDNVWDVFAEVLDWWGPEFFLPEDFKKMRQTNGSMQPSLAERAYTLAVKSILLAAERGVAAPEDIERLVSELDTLLNTHPEFQYTLYHKILLLKALGNMEETIETARNFIKANQQYAWAWSKLGEVLEEDPIRLACYCRALLCKSSQESQIKVRRPLIDMLYEAGEYPAAKREILEVQKYYEAKGRDLPERISELIAMPWFEETEAAETNVPFYHSHVEPTRDFLFGGVPETAILINKLNTQKQTAAYITEDQRRGFFPAKRMNVPLVENAVYKVRFAQEPDGKTPSHILTIRPVEDLSEYEGKLLRHLRAEINIRPGQTFTFVDGIYIDGTLVQNLTPGTMADIVAVAYYNIKKSEWGWRAISVEPDFNY
ncbi:MAG: hypothetical protein K2N88_01855 [Muribaculaceae bacterium]|nr:hypothetical protein [Muribaculaceae bacterium]